MTAGLGMIVLVIGFAAAPGPAASSRPSTMTSTAPAGPTVPPDDADVRQIVRQLNHPSPARRKAALRQLAAWGPFAFRELQRAAEGPDHEAALSAQSLRAELQAAILIGGQVRLEVDRPRIVWNEPLTLTIRVKNPTPVPIRVPWPRSDETATQPASADAEQVGRILDVADWLTVIGPDGRPIDLRFEPVDGDAAVYEAASLRAGTRPPSSELLPGAEATLRVTQFNRGWARYPLLAAGTCRIEFAYQPEWKDPSWVEAGYGRVQAEPVTVEVTKAAPEAIRLASRPLQLRLVPGDKSIRAELLSTWDRPLHINLNQGPDPTRYAEFLWEFKPTGTDTWSQWEPEPESSQTGLRADRIRRIDSGESLEITRLTSAEVFKRAAVTPSAGSCEAKLRYTNLPNTRQLRDQAAARGETVAIPCPLFTGVLLSEPVRVNPPGG